MKSPTNKHIKLLTEKKYPHNKKEADSLLYYIISSICFEHLKPLSSFIYSTGSSGMKSRMGNYSDRLIKLIERKIKESRKTNNYEDFMSILMEPVFLSKEQIKLHIDKHDMLECGDMENVNEIEDEFLEFSETIYNQSFKRKRKINTRR
jgi:hypothetical protein